MRKEDVRIGDKFGHLTIVSECYFLRKKEWASRRIYVDILCDCGKNKSVSIGSLKKEPSHACGCRIGKKRKASKIGDVFGRLTVVSEPYIKKADSENGRRAAYVDVLCSCGKRTSVVLSKLKLNPNRSCGCRNKGQRKQPIPKINDVFGSWTIISDGYEITDKKNKQTRLYFDAMCYCGKERRVDYYSLVHGKSISCGCRGKNRNRLFGTAFDSVLTGMHNRCYKKETAGYDRYGGRGITLTDEWNQDIVGKIKALQNFYNWAKDEYRPGLQIDRRDNDKEYSPENCRWVTPKEQARNKSSNRVFTFGNETKCLAAWGEDPRCAVTYGTLQSRIRQGQSFQDAFTKPQEVTLIFFTMYGETKNLKAWSKDARCMVKYGTLHSRIKDNWNFHDAFTTPPGKKPIPSESPNRLSPADIVSEVT